MRQIKIMGLAFVVMLALGAMAASGAAAMAPKLVLKEEGASTPFPTGSSVKLVFSTSVGNCAAPGEGTLSRNARPKDMVNSIAILAPSCEGGVTMTGGVKSISMSVSGAVIVHVNKLRLHLPGMPCTYQFHKFGGNFLEPTLAVMGGTSVGTLVKNESGTGCAASEETEWEAAVEDEFNRFLETEVS